MKESKFIEQNKEKWQRYEEMLVHSNVNNRAQHTQLLEAYEGITDDLNFARTFFYNRSVRVYLNELAQRVYIKLYQKRRNQFTLIADFVKNGFPKTMWALRAEILVSFCLFVLAFAIGWHSSANDAGFAELILGERYVAMTEANMQSGNAMAVYKTSRSDEMFWIIFLNNLWVDFLSFASGFFYGVVTVFVVLKNGIMVGTFQHFFFERGFIWESVSTIWMHGTLEMCSLILSGASGLALGRALIFTGNLSRKESLLRSGFAAVSLLIGVIPLTFVAAVIEGFLTGSGWQIYFKMLVIGLSLALVIGYLGVYCFVRGYQLRQVPLSIYRFSGQKSHAIHLNKSKKSGQIFSEAVVLLFRQSRHLILFCAAIILLLCSLGYLMDGIPELKSYGVLDSLFSGLVPLPLLGSLFTETFWEFTLAWSVGLGLFVFMNVKRLKMPELESISILKSNLIGMGLGVLVCMEHLLLVFIPFWLHLLFLWFLFILFWQLRDRNANTPVPSFPNAIGFRSLGTAFTTLILSMAALLMVNAPAMYFIEQGLLVHFIFSTELGAQVTEFLRLGAVIFIYIMSLTLALLAAGLSYFSAKENLLGLGLKSKLKSEDLL